MFFGVQTALDALIPGVSGIHHNVPPVQAFAHNPMSGLFHCKTITYTTENAVAHGRQISYDPNMRIIFGL